MHSMPDQLQLEIDWDARPTGRADGSWLVTPRPRPGKRWLSVEETGRRLGVGRKVIYELLEAGVLRGRKKNPLARENSPWLIEAASVAEIEKGGVE